MAIDVIEVEDIESAELTPSDASYTFNGEAEGLLRVEIKRPCGDYFSCPAVMEFFGLSPAYMVETLRKYKDIIGIYSDVLTVESRRFFYDEDNNLYNCVHLLDNARFHYREVRQLFLCLTQDNSEAVEAALKKINAEHSSQEKDARIAVLEAELAAAAQSAPVNNTPEKPPLTPQQKASLARQEKTLEAWKPAILAMIRVAVVCGEEGKKLRQQPDFNRLFNEISAVLSDTQMKFFRACLPKGHIDRKGGPRGKS